MLPGGPRGRMGQQEAAIDGVVLAAWTCDLSVARLSFGVSESALSSARSPLRVCLAA